MKMDSIVSVYENKITVLEQSLNELNQKISQKEKQNDLEALLKEAQTFSAQKKVETVDISKKFQSGVRKQQGLNPNISLGGDFFAGASTINQPFLNDVSDISYGMNRFEMREAQISLVSPLDPFTRGKTFISITKDKISIEEAYLEWLNLPLNMNLKAGIFYPEFGAFNRYHDHALPQFDRPRPLINLFGNKGLGGFGIASNFLLPPMAGADASSFDIAVQRGGNGFSFTDEGTYNLIVSAKFKNYYDLTASSYLEWALSGAGGNNDPSENRRSYIGSLNINYKWAPVGREKYRTFDWKNEFLISRRDTGIEFLNTIGFFSTAQYKLGARSWLGARFDYTELPWDGSQHECVYTANFDFWQSEFVLMRLQYQFNDRNLSNVYGYNGALPDNSALIWQVSWAMGPDKHESY